MLDIAENPESGEDEDKKAPPAFTKLLSALFGPLIEYAESCGICDAGHFLCEAKMVFFAAHAAKPARQLDIRAYRSRIGR